MSIVDDAIEKILADKKATLKEAYFRRLKLEKHGKTPRLTQEIDLLELAIRDLTEHLKNEQNPQGV